MKRQPIHPDGGRVWTSRDLTSREPDELCIPIRGVLEPEESLALGLRQSLVDLDPEPDEDEPISGSVVTSIGNDLIILQFECGDIDRSAVVRGSELLKRWVRSFNPEMADRIPGLG